mmetsp:Transcript_101228/g.264463  ORF Transcript_101228/g.264463 Transcript_101228/m.264463 type:complete len:195 (-) Transcript_101228:154-738(-)
MEDKPFPTRAEAVDVANAVLDGATAVMLSSETAMGKFPVVTVNTMRRICEEAEAFIDYKSLYMQSSASASAGGLSSVEAVCNSAVKAAMDSKAALIMALTETGATALMLAKYRPEAPILAISASEMTIRQLLLARGVVPIATESFQGTDSVIAKGLAKAKELGLVKTGDLVVAVHGTREECAGATNMMKIVTVP